MGHIKTNSQVDQAGQKTENTMLEITYGGLESPFGGIDSSAPAAYIDPKCFADADGFLVIDNKLVAISWSNLAVPALWNDVPGVILLEIGTFYNSIWGQINYALGYTQTPFAGPPAGAVYTFYITSWSAITGASFGTAVLETSLYAGQQAGIAASLTVPVIAGESSSYTDSGNLSMTVGNTGGTVGTASFAYTPGMTVAQMVTGIISSLNALTSTSHIIATSSNDGLGVVLTADSIGTGGNDLWVSDASASGTSGNVPAFYFPIAAYPVRTNLGGGFPGIINAVPIGPYVISTTEVGGILYIAGIGPFILKYSIPNSTGQGFLQISSAYAGVRVIAKFAGSLIGLGDIPQLSALVQNSDMVFSWSASNNLDEWSPVDASGNVTGAGFAQLADISDALKGLVVSNNVAWIIREQGLSYAVATSNGTQPFQFCHVGLADQGEGAQRSELVAQYDQAGAFVGNTNIFQLASSISPIGDKIKAALFQALEEVSGNLSSFGNAVFIGGDAFPLVYFLVGNIIFIYNPGNGTWMKSTYTQVNLQQVADLNAVYADADHILQSITALALQGESAPGVPIVPTFSQLVEGIVTLGSRSTQNQITFPQEELLFGRDVTIDALYISMWGDLNIPLNGLVSIQFYFNGVLFSTLDLDPTIFNTLSGNPVELKVFPTNTNGTGVFTSHSPQLQLKIVSRLGTESGQIRFSKIQEYATFDPNQRPV